MTCGADGRAERGLGHVRHSERGAGGGRDDAVDRQVHGEVEDPLLDELHEELPPGPVGERLDGGHAVDARAPLPDVRLLPGPVEAAEVGQGAGEVGFPAREGDPAEGVGVPDEPGDGPLVDHRHAVGAVAAPLLVPVLALQVGAVPEFDLPADLDAVVVLLPHVPVDGGEPRRVGGVFAHPVGHVGEPRRRRRAWPGSPGRSG